MRTTKQLLPGGVIGHDGSNAGRPPEWLKAECVKIIKKGKLIKFLERVAIGEKIIETDIYDLKGEKIGHSESTAAPKDRLKAVEMLMERGFGKPEQTVNIPDLHDFKIVRPAQIEPKVIDIVPEVKSA